MSQFNRPPRSTNLNFERLSQQMLTLQDELDRLIIRLPEEKRLKTQDFGLQMLLYYQGMSLPQYDYPPYVKADLLKQMQDLLFNYGVIDKKNNLTEFIDNRFVKKIYEKLK